MNPRAKIQTKLLILLATFATSYVHADFMFEPYIGVESTAQTGKTVALVDAKGDAAGSALGLRIGSDHGPIWLALDYSRSTGGKIKFDNTILTAAYGDMEIAREDFGLTIGFDFPILIRAWAGYAFQDTMKTESSVDGNNAYKGTHTKFGIGFTGLPFISINVEYIVRTYTSWTGDNKDAGQDFEDVWKDLKQNTTVVTLSLPL